MGVRTWTLNRPSLLEWAYRITTATFHWMHPLIRRLGYERAARWLIPMERFSKKALFDCQMCGQCTLHATGMVCPMTCPKHLRNGACGGVRSNGNCEVIPDMKCVWVVAYERAREMRVFGPELISIKPPVDHQLKDSSAWINMLTGVDKSTPTGWSELPHNPVIEKKL
ncbi:MAG: methylenetetrahydrofolate reductase C-terminal domain-containing protein [Woeseiaceae bacterium]